MGDEARENHKGVTTKKNIVGRRKRGKRKPNPEPHITIRRSF